VSEYADDPNTGQIIPLRGAAVTGATVTGAAVTGAAVGGGEVGGGAVVGGAVAGAVMGGEVTGSAGVGGSVVGGEPIGIGTDAGADAVDGAIDGEGGVACGANACGPVQLDRDGVANVGPAPSSAARAPPDGAGAAGA
jgi:hypothetical protein